MITTQNTNLISSATERGNVVCFFLWWFISLFFFFLTEHCKQHCKYYFLPILDSCNLLSCKQLQLHVAKSELIIFAMSQFLFLFFLTPANSINIPSASKVRKFWVIFYFLLFLPSISWQILLTLPLKYFSNSHLLFILMVIAPVQCPIFLATPHGPFAIILFPIQLILPSLLLRPLTFLSMHYYSPQSVLHAYSFSLYNGLLKLCYYPHFTNENKQTEPKNKTKKTPEAQRTSVTSPKSHW